MNNQKKINGLPLYDDMMTQEYCGMLRISLVDFPAVESDFRAYNEPVKVQFSDEDKRLIIGVVMRANYPIFRRSEELGEHYIQYSAETIRKMAEKYLEEGRQNRVNLMHAGSEVKGVQMVQLFIKDSASGIVPKGFEDIEDGSLFAEFHIVDDDIWGWIKQGILRGFSLEGYFDMQPTLETTKGNIMLKKLFKKMLAKQVFEKVSTSGGVLTYEGALEVGTDVYLLTEDGDVADVPNGEYTLEDGRKLVVADGEITDIISPEPEPDKLEEPKDGEPTDQVVGDEVDIKNLYDEVQRLKADRDALMQRVEELEKALNTSKAELAAIKKMSAAQPAKEDIKGKGEPVKAQFSDDHTRFLHELANS